MAEKIQRAIDLEQLPKALDSRIGSVPYNAYNEYLSERFVFNSRGVRAHQKENYVYAYAYPLAKQGDDTRQGGEVYFGRDARNVPIQEIVKQAVEKTVSKLGATPPETGRYSIVIDRDQVVNLVGVIADYFSAKSVAEKTSIFSGDRGQVIASPLFTLLDDPKIEGGMGNRSFDGEGAPTIANAIVDGGVLKNFMTNSVYAKRLGLPHTANAARSAKGSLARKNRCFFSHGLRREVIGNHTNKINDLIAIDNYRVSSGFGRCCTQFADGLFNCLLHNFLNRHISSVAPKVDLTTLPCVVALFRKRIGVGIDIIFFLVGAHPSTVENKALT
jgi:hypothetical protein